MNYKLEKENKNVKRIIIGITTFFCVIILIIGATIAYFTQSDTKDMNSLVTTDIRDTLKYTDNKNYMRQELIPAKEEIAKQAYALENDNKCIDKYGYSACSVYEFNIKNIANVSQELIIDMAPTINGFTNLYFILYEIDDEGNNNEIISSQKIDTVTEEMIQNSTISSYNLTKDLILNPNSDKTYQIVFFVNDTGKDQTLEDSGKSFGATIKISSVTTGKYMVESFGEDCWETELLSDGTYKLTEFKGIDNTYNYDEEQEEYIKSSNYGKINQSCTGYVSIDESTNFYSIKVPSNIGAKKISTIGNQLFLSLDLNTYTLKNYTNIENITIAEGITTIENGIVDPENYVIAGAFSGVGLNPMTQEKIVDELTIKFPSSLNYIGDAAFTSNALKKISVPKDVIYFGKSVFQGNPIIEEVVFNNSENKELELVIGDEAFSSTNLSKITLSSNISLIGKSAFDDTKLSEVIIPNNVTSIGDSAFYQNNNLTTLRFEEGSKLTTIGESAFYSNNISTLTIPSSVETIGTDAFRSNENLTTLIFEEGSKLKTIGDRAFISCALDYQKEESPLYLPNTITTMGAAVFLGNENLKYIKFIGSTTGFGNNWNGDATILADE